MAHIEGYEAPTLVEIGDFAELTLGLIVPGPVDYLGWMSFPE
jgi:hypothetical protein